MASSCLEVTPARRSIPQSMRMLRYAKLSCGLFAGEAVEDVLNDLPLTRGQLMVRHERLLQLQRAGAGVCPLQLSATEGEGSSSANYTRSRREISVIHRT